MFDDILQIGFDNPTHIFRSNIRLLLDDGKEIYLLDEDPISIFKYRDNVILGSADTFFVELNENQFTVLLQNCCEFEIVLLEEGNGNHAYNLLDSKQVTQDTLSEYEFIPSCVKIVQCVNLLPVKYEVQDKEIFYVEK